MSLITAHLVYFNGEHEFLRPNLSYSQIMTYELECPEVLHCRKGESSKPPLRGSLRDYRTSPYMMSLLPRHTS
jgi:hypothetical protein